MKTRNFLLTVAVLLAMPLLASAQEEASIGEIGDAAYKVLLPKVPKVEFSVGGGIGIGGYLGTFPDHLWMDHIGQSTGEEKNMLFYPAKSGLRLSGHAGLYVDFNFTDHWGLITGAEFGAYTSVVKSKNLLNMQVLYNNYETPTAGEVSIEDWVSQDLPDFSENHRMFAVQVPVMAKYMVPIAPLKGHLYYVAAGVKLGIHVSSQYKQSWGEGKYSRYAHRWFIEGDPSGESITTNNGYAKDGGFATRVDPWDDFVGDSSRSTDWLKLKFSPIDVMASFDTGFRWNLGNGMGLYTGLYCDFGLLRPVVHQTGSKVMTYDPDKNPAVGDGDGEITVEGAKYVSILAADGPDYAWFKHDEQEPEGKSFFIKNSNPLAKTLNAMQAGVKVRFSIGRARRPVRPVREPKIKEPKKPKEPPVITEVPEEIQQTMIELSDALFAFDKFDLNAEAQAMLDRVVSWLSDHPELKVEIGGHTDSRGSDAYNQKLSENRAKSVYDYFVSHGIDAARLSYKGYGESRPIDTNETDEGRQRNRRVELQLIQEPQE